MSDLLFTLFCNLKATEGLTAKRFVQNFCLHYSIQRKMLSINFRA